MICIFFLTKNKKIIFDVCWPEFLMVNRLRASGLNAILWDDNFFALLVVPSRMLANVYWVLDRVFGVEAADLLNFYYDSLDSLENLLGNPFSIDNPNTMLTFTNCRHQHSCRLNLKIHQDVRKLLYNYVWATELFFTDVQ